MGVQTPPFSLIWSKSVDSNSGLPQCEWRFVDLQNILEFLKNPPGIEKHEAQIGACRKEWPHHYGWNRQYFSGRKPAMRFIKQGSFFRPLLLCV
jgi:hypothetical protein